MGVSCGMKKTQNQFYRSWKFWTIVLAVLLFLCVFEYKAAKNAPPPWQHSYTSLNVLY